LKQPLDTRRTFLSKAAGAVVGLLASVYAPGLAATGLSPARLGPAGMKARNLGMTARVLVLDEHARVY
jgi:hypothetical protein